MLIIEIAVAKAPKYAVRESGDTVEVIERPRGGLSLVMADGQRSGHSAKAISNIAVRKAVTLLAEGVRDGAVARAAHDYLRTQRGGQVSAELTILSVDLETRTLVISRNSRCPVWMAGAVVGAPDAGSAWTPLDQAAEPVGLRARTRPVIVEFPLVAPLTVVAFTDGILHAGARAGRSLDPRQVLTSLAHQPTITAQQLADGLLAAALALDEGRPADDVSVAALALREQPAGDGPEIRRMTVSFPVPPI